MSLPTLRDVLFIIQHFISFLGVILILSGVLIAAFQYVRHLVTTEINAGSPFINTIRLNLGRTLVLGLEFIVAADLIGTTTMPDYYSIGIVACIVLIRTLLNYTLNKELMNLSKEQNPRLQTR